MAAIDKFRFDGKKVLVVGGATGMGGAGAELALSLGADVVVLDYAEIKLDGVEKIKVNLADKGSIDQAMQQIEGRVDIVFSCAGVADGTPDIEKINFLGHRYLIETLIDSGRLTHGGSICVIASSAGLGWEQEFVELSELLDIDDFDAAAEWMRAHGKTDYVGSKRAMNAYVARQAFSLLKRGIRINAICPGPTDTPLAQANKEAWLGSGADFREAAGIQPSTPMEQAYPMAFLCSDAAAAISGITLISDLGWFNSGLVHSFPPATPMAEWLLGRSLPKPA